MPPITPNPIPETFVGIDVAKAWLDVVALPGGRHQRIANDPDGWHALCCQLRPHPPTLIVLEATGTLGAGVTNALDAAGMTPVVANPLTTRRFAQSLGRRAKTDRVDAKTLAQFGDQMRPVPRPVPSGFAQELQGLLARREQLTRMLVMEQNRSHAAAAAVQPSITATIAFLRAQRTAIDHAVAAQVASDPAWQARVDQLDSVPGIAVQTATVLAVGLPELGTLTTKQIASLVGVAPVARDSGRQRGTRHIAAGRSAIRHALYRAVLTTIRCDPTFHAHYAQLRARGKLHKVAMVACLRRLLGILNAMVRDGLTWTQTAVAQGRFLAEAT